MAITRSMSGATKKTIALNNKVGRASKQTRLKKGDREIKANAFSIFMIKDYLQRYFQTHPPPTHGGIPDEADLGGRQEWLNMSDADKDPWIDFAKKMKDQGVSLFQIKAEAYAHK